MSDLFPPGAKRLLPTPGCEATLGEVPACEAEGEGRSPLGRRVGGVDEDSETS